MVTMQVYLSNFKGHVFENTSNSHGFRVKKRIGNKNQETYVALHKLTLGDLF